MATYSHRVIPLAVLLWSLFDASMSKDTGNQLSTCPHSISEEPICVHLHNIPFDPWVSLYSLHFKIKVTFGHKLRYEIKIAFGEISLKLRQTNLNVARNNVNVVDDELSSQIPVYTCLTIDIWTQRRQHT